MESLEAVEASLLALCLDEDTQNPSDHDKSKKDMLRYWHSWTSSLSKLKSLKFTVSYRYRLVRLR